MLKYNSNEFKILSELQSKPKSSRRELLKNLNLNESTLSYTLAKLRGLVETQKDKTTKIGRKKLLYSLTKAGRLQLRATFALQ